MSRLSNHDPSRLARLFSVNTDDMPSWFPSELADIWRHQLTAPLALDLADTETDSAKTVDQFARIGQEPLRTFGDLLVHPSPPLKLLCLVKEFAKVRRTRKHAAYPAEAATALYYAAIALALLRHGAQITQLKPDELRQGFEWARDLNWLDEPTRQIFCQAMEALSSR
jgi:hypothetical protein